MLTDREQKLVNDRVSHRYDQGPAKAIASSPFAPRKGDLSQSERRHLLRRRSSPAGNRDPHRLHQHLHVIPGVAFHFGGTEQVRGMVGHDDLAVAIGVKFAPQLAHGPHGSQQGLSRDGAQAADELGLEKFQLTLEERPAISHFVGQRGTIAGRAALEHVQDVHVFPF